MRYLIDTNIFIRVVIDGYLQTKIKEIINDYENIIYVSSESIKEYIHLHKNKKIASKKNICLHDILDFTEQTLGFIVKYAAKEHLKIFSKLDLVEGHGDPSDRLIIAQAITEKIPLISSDSKFPKYRKQGLQFIQNY